MLVIDIDTGGTMTDALVNDGKQVCAFKTDTTPHDFTVSFRNVLLLACEHYGFEKLSDFLSEVRFIRWSTTVTTNVLGERKGSKIGLLVNAGNEERLYGPGPSPVIEDLIERGNIIGLPDGGQSQDVLNAVRMLLEEGVRRICVCLEDQYPDNETERTIRTEIESQYPDHCLGSVPVLLGSEMSKTPDDTTRVHYSVMNAYIHTALASSLFKAEDDLKQKEGWQGTLLIGHTNGGVARVGKTKAVDTIESGPIFGTHAGAFFARQYGLETAVCFDVGGTTTKASVVRDARPVFKPGGDLMGVPVQTNIALLRSAVLGGGSVASLGTKGEIRLGPESMGASPGPACYGLGSNEATLTDALVILGYLDPNNFLGGRRQLDVAKAREVIDEKLAQSLNVQVEEAAVRVVNEAVRIMAGLVEATLAEANVRPEETTLFGYGGNGPIFAAAVAERLSIPAVYVFSLGPVFSALGSAISNVVHQYECGIGRRLDDSSGTDLIESSILSMRQQAERDLSGEGFDPADAEYELELDVRGDDGQLTTWTVDDIGSADTLTGKRLRDLLAAAGRNQGGSASVEVVTIRLRAQVEIATYQPKKTRKTASKSAKPTDKRVVWLSNGAMVSSVDADVYAWDKIGPGTKICGPAISADGTVTCLIPQDWVLTKDPFGNGRLTPQ